jgi:predicted nucleic acid-binding protein
MIHLDTSFLIRSLVRGSTQDRTLRRWLAKGESVGVSAVAWTEFLCGPVAAADVDAVAEVLSECVPYGAQEARLAADLFNRTGRRRGSLLDCMIAATALSRDAGLATVNADDFRRFGASGLALASG